MEPTTKPKICAASLTAEQKLNLVFSFLEAKYPEVLGELRLTDDEVALAANSLRLARETGSGPLYPQAPSPRPSILSAVTCELPPSAMETEENPDPLADTDDVIQASQASSASSESDILTSSSTPSTSDTEDDGYTVVTAGKRKARSSTKKAPPAKVSNNRDTTQLGGNKKPQPPSTAGPSTATPASGLPTQSAAYRSQKPTPLIIRDSSAWNHISAVLNQRRLQYTHAKSTPDGIRVIVPTIADHRAMTAYLTAQRYEYHTYALPEERQLRAVIRNLPVGIETELIEDSLKEQNLPVQAVHRMYKGRNKDPYDMVLVVLDRSIEGKQIFKLKSVCGLIGLKVEPPRRNGPGQCHRCQLYGHSANKCYARHRCVKCLGDHGTKDCNRTAETVEPPACVLCGTVGHTANYRGCPRAPQINRRVMRQTNMRRPQPARAPAQSIPPTTSSQEAVADLGVAVVPSTAPIPQAPTPIPVPSVAVGTKAIPALMSVKTNAWSKPLSYTRQAVAKPRPAKPLPTPPASPSGSGTGGGEWAGLINLLSKVNISKVRALSSALNSAGKDLQSTLTVFQDHAEAIQSLEDYQNSYGS